MKKPLASVVKCLILGWIDWLRFYLLYLLPFYLLTNLFNLHFLFVNPLLDMQRLIVIYVLIQFIIISFNYFLYYKITIIIKCMIFML